MLDLLSILVYLCKYRYMYTIIMLPTLTEHHTNTSWKAEHPSHSHLDPHFEDPRTAQLISDIYLNSYCVTVTVFGFCHVLSIEKRREEKEKSRKIERVCANNIDTHH